jgi:hypothetical protein
MSGDNRKVGVSKSGCFVWDIHRLGQGGKIITAVCEERIRKNKKRKASPWLEKPSFRVADSDFSRSPELFLLLCDFLLRYFFRDFLFGFLLCHNCNHLLSQFSKRINLYRFHNPLLVIIVISSSIAKKNLHGFFFNPAFPKKLNLRRDFFFQGMTGVLSVRKTKKNVCQRVKYCFRLTYNAKIRKSAVFPLEPQKMKNRTIYSADDDKKRIQNKKWIFFNISLEFFTIQQVFVSF